MRRAVLTAAYRRAILSRYFHANGYPAASSYLPDFQDEAQHYEDPSRISFPPPYLAHRFDRAEYEESIFEPAVDFRKTTTWEEVNGVVESLGENLTARQLGAAFFQLKRLNGRPPPSFLKFMADRAISLEQSFDLRTAVNVFQSCTHLKYLNAELFEVLGRGVIEGIGTTDFRDVSRLFYCLGALHRTWQLRGCPNAKSGQYGFFPCQQLLLSKLAIRTTYDFCKRWYDPASIGLLVQGLGQLQFYNATLLHEVSQLLFDDRNLNGLSPRSMAMTLMGFARVGYKDTLMLSHVTKQCTQGHMLRVFNEQDLCNVIYALGELKFRSNEVYGLLLSEATMNDRLARYDHQGLVHMLSGLGSIGFTDLKGILKPIVDEVVRPVRLSTFENKELTTLVYSLGLIKNIGKQFWSHLALEINDSNRIDNFDAEDLANIAYGLAKAGLKTYDINIENFIHELGRIGRLPQYSDEALCNVVYSLGSMHVDPDKALSSLTNEVVNPTRLERYTPQVFSNLLYGFGKSGYRKVGVLEKCMAQMTQVDRLEEFTDQALSKVLYAIGRLNYGQDRNVQFLLDEFVKPHRVQRMDDWVLSYSMYCLGMSKIRTPRFIDPLVDELVSSHRLRRISDHELALAVHGLGLGQYDDSEKIGLIVNELMHPGRWGRMSGRDIGLIAYGLGMMKHVDLKFWTNLAQEANGPLYLKEFDPQTIGMVLFGFAKMEGFSRSGAQNTVAHLVDALKVQGRLDMLKTQDAANCSWGLAGLGYYDPQVMDALSNKFIALFNRKIDRVGELGSVLHSCALLNHSNMALTDFVVNGILNELAEELSDTLDAEFVGITAWSLAVLGVLDSKVFGKLLDVFVEIKQKGWEVSDRDMRQMHRAFMYVKTIHNFRPLSSKHTDILREAQKVAISHDQYILKKNLNEEIRGVLHILGVKWKEGVMLEDVCMNVDFLMTCVDQNWVVEVYDESRFTSNSMGGLNDQRLLGGSVLKNKILEAKGYKVIPILLPEWERTPRKDRRRWVASILKQISEKSV